MADFQPSAAEDDADLRYHAGLHGPVSECPLIEGRVRLLADGASAIRAILDAIEQATDHVHLEYYIVEDVRLDGRSLFDLLERKARAGVEVAVIWDSVGSQETPDADFDRLEAAGVRLLEYHSINPLRRHFNISVNDRDHRKLTVVDSRVGFLGGVNLSRVYETPASVARGRDPDTAYWIDNAIRIEGAAVLEIQKLFFHTWSRHGGDARPLRGCPVGMDTGAAAGGTGDFRTGDIRTGQEMLRIDGSAPRERRPLYNSAIRAAIGGARRSIVLATGYFVPSAREVRLLVAAARRGISIDLLLAGYSDVPAAMHAARQLYGTLLGAGARIHEVHRGMLHAKVATIDGVWTAIGSSNFDRRSVYFNNEIDAIVLGRATAASVEAMLREEIGRAARVELEAWRRRPVRDRIKELLTVVVRPLM